jgi:hypothetical protein
MSRRASFRRWALGLAFALPIALGGAGVALWWLYVRAPAPEQVCAHLVELTLRDGGDQAPRAVEAAVERIERRCVADKARILRMRDKMTYARYARCVVAASTLELAERC